MPMRIRIILVGKIKESFLRDGFNEYLKRLSYYAQVQLVELADEPVPETSSEKDLEIARKTEAKRIFHTLKEGEYVIAMDIQGKRMSSPELAKWLEERALTGVSSLSFIIGGTTGLDSSVKSKAQLLLSFSPLTFPHQFMPLLLAEQIYRAFRINAGEPYHR